MSSLKHMVLLLMAVRGDFQIKFIKDDKELFVFESAGIYNDKHVYTSENIRYQFIF